MTSASYPTIASAVAGSGCSAISLALGTYHEHSLVVTHDLTIMAAGFPSTVVDGGSAGVSVFTIQSGMTA
ncbi:MAG: hypothetical protein JOZ41_05535 [Chloroflexi bacterium]|nr:hypothetical protein [Chloroflexota bacterium]